jgi:hypothetical protein
MTEYIAGLTRKEFIALPMEERHKRLAEQAKEFVKNHGYLPDDPCDGHSTMIQPKTKMVTRKVREQAKSLIITIPVDFAREQNIKPGDKIRIVWRDTPVLIVEFFDESKSKS